MKNRIMLVGEPMGLFIAEEEALLEDVRHYSTSVAGAEFNVAVGLARLGHPVGYLTKLGSDPFGRQIVKVMNRNSINTSMVMKSKDHATGFMLKSKTSHGDPDIYYFRKNSAASTICPEDLNELDLSEYCALHMTGILPALSSSARESAFELIRKAKNEGLKVFFDPNLRPQLWPSREVMIQTINELASMADYVLPGENEGEILCGTRDPKKIAEFYLSRGAKAVIVKIGPKGAYAATEKYSFYSPTYPAEKIVDTVGAGDGFAAGVISALTEGLSLEEAVRRANAIGTIQIMNVSDNEGLPTRDELNRFMTKYQQQAE
ncbi:2-dehydro-3-deoxygluconokinase [Caprobacter fermentans]|uniref:2-dehydro-3-deoxygluconokinase n=1 Tax=Caproicibacter fermentans TaxID=2576756 RepID=A0A6N8I1Q7_9FIRM|nr:sugar kinase [Caproicibacter fermentans]MVB11972.1 2-dehydro-3-deoxygluconokinase [Caproicibacter fermentans]OCM99803.1 2-dehydro-3-deoxygluconokinase [Clostridium sp. W14A]